MSLSPIKISKRLSAAADFARKGSFIADVGTDHAYLPIYLCEAGMIRGAVASDVNVGPMKRAESHVTAYALETKITVCLADGLDGLEKYSPEDIFMLGMGGELIVALLSRAEWLKSRDIRLILQPMTHPEAVRSYLLDSGFTIIDETLVRDDKIYQIICAQFGNDYPVGYNSADKLGLHVGRLNLERGGDLLVEHLLHWKEILTVRKQGKLSGSPDADISEEAELLSEIEKILQRK